MHYMGGKSRIAGEISEVINGEISRRETSNISRNCGCDKYIYIYNKPFVSLFCGACNVESRIKSERIICNDKHEYLIAMWQALQRGYELPDSISEEQYRYIMAHKDEDKALAGFVGFACSFGGKWFGGYARGNRTNYAGTGKRHTLKCFEGLRNAEFMCMDYRDVPIPKGAVIYADPPYINTTGYSCGKFDTNAFWEYMRVLSNEHLVFISEQDAPNDFVPLWEKSCRRYMTNNINNGFVTTEKLFVHKSKLSELQQLGAMR